MFFILTVTILSISLLVLHWLWNKKTPAINWPLIGMAPTLLRNAGGIHDQAAWLLKQSGGTFWCRGLWFTDMDFLLTSDPINVDYILNKKSADYIKATPETREILEPLGDGIFNSDSDMWRYQRRIIHSSFKLQEFELTAERIVKGKILDGLLLVLEHGSKLGSEMDLQDVFQRFTFDVICLLVLGFDPNCVSVEFPKVAYEKAFDEIEEVFLYRNCLPRAIWKMQKWLQVGQEKRLRKAWEAFDDFLSERISLKRNQITNRTETTKDFDLLTRFMTEDDRFVRDNAFNLLIAGRDTVGVALSWLFWLVLTHPVAEEKIIEELKQCSQIESNKKHKIFGFEELKQLPYLQGAICETLRLYPSVPYEKRQSIRPDILPSGHRVRKNTKIVYSPYAMGRMEEIWGGDFAEFKPERWISEQGEMKRVASFKFSAFGAGPRACLGKALSFMEMKAVAASVLWNYRFQVVDNHLVCPSSSVILHMKHGLKVLVSQRNIS